MEYQKIANLIDDTSNQPSKFRTRNWVEINDESRGANNVNSQIKFKTSMLKSSLCDYSDAYLLVKATIIVNNTLFYFNLLYSRRNKRNYSRLFTRSSKSIVNIL